MAYYRLNMKIVGRQDFFWRIKVCYKLRRVYIYYNSDSKQLNITGQGRLGRFLQLRKPQLLRLFNNKRVDSFYVGFKLSFVLSNDFITKQHFDRNSVMVIDNRNRKRKIYRKKEVSTSMDCEIFTDGSYNHENGIGAYAVMIRRPEQETEIATYRDYDHSNNSLELKAILAAFEKVKSEKCILVTTDSQYVIKGITSWIQNWKRNKWRTANGEVVKNIDLWRKLDRIIKGKYVEFKWVRAHDTHPENNLCDFFAKLKTKELD